MSYRRLLIPVILVVALLGVALFFFRSPADMPAPSNHQQQEPAPNQTELENPESEQPVTSFNKNQHSIDELGSIWQIVNKKRALPANYVPSDLVVPDVRLRLAASHEQMKIRKVVESDLAEMFKAAQQDSVTLVFGSGYRSYALQKQFYDSYVARDGQAEADRYSARPGTSEHQTGLSFDATSTSGKCHLEVCFENMDEGKWIKANAHKYGFIIRYPEGKEGITGYQYEPWHLRYVGRELAAEINRTNQTLEEFFDL